MTALKKNPNLQAKPFQTFTYKVIKMQLSVCKKIYKPEARIEYTAGPSIRFVYKNTRPVDLNSGVKFWTRKHFNIFTD